MKSGKYKIAVHFYLDNPKKGGEQNIFLSASYGGKRIIIAVSVKVDASEWDFKLQRSKKDLHLNSLLDDLKNQTESMYMEHHEINKDLLRDISNNKIKKYLKGLYVPDISLEARVKNLEEKLIGVMNIVDGLMRMINK